MSQSSQLRILSPDSVIPCASFYSARGMDIQNQRRFTTKIYEQLRPYEQVRIASAKRFNAATVVKLKVWTHTVGGGGGVRFFSPPNL
jgi:hypothetical protein